MTSGSVKVASIALLGVALAACAAALPRYEGPPAGERFNLLMGIDGELELEGQCLVLAASPGRILLIWPMPGTRWNPITRSVSLDGITAQVGDRIIVADYLEGEWPEDDWADWIGKPSEECQYPLAMVVRGMRLEEPTQR